MHSDSDSGGITALVASHNRRDLTLAAIELFANSARNASTAARIVLVDDGSSDGTGQAVSESATVPVDIIDGDGNWFWARSLATAERRALESRADTGHLLWLNDDVRLDQDAVARLLTTASAHPHSVVVGSVRDEESGAVTYGGLKRSGRHPLAFQLIAPLNSSTTQAATMNGNVVLVPVALARDLGGVDGDFSHAFADIDYGLRARNADAGPVVAAGTFGTCSRNPVHRSSTRREAWRHFVSPKGGGDPSAIARILKVASPRSWWFWWFATYAAWWVRRWRPAESY